MRMLITACFVVCLLSCTQHRPVNGILLKNVTLIDGTGHEPVEHSHILIQGDTITSIGMPADTSGLQIIDLTGKTIMPALISAHVHIGTLKGTTTVPQNYTRDNILAQLKKYEQYGILTVLALGTDRPLLYENGFYDSLKQGLLDGARLHSAGYGFGVPTGAPPLNFSMDRVFRPTSKSSIPAQLDSLVAIKAAIVKIWVDDFGGTSPKMDSSIYKTIITEAHKRNLRVAAHLYYLSDAHKLVAQGLDVIAHSIRDTLVDDALVQEMKEKHVAYIPTLSLDEFAYIYAREPEWVNDAFFKASLEPGVYDMISSAGYKDKIKNAPNYQRNVHAFEMALKNLKKLYDGGVTIALGTDSGAQPVRAQGFSEHLELELMVQAGLTPLQAITIATNNAAKVLEIDNRYGTLQPGKAADFILLKKNPVDDIQNTRKIDAVYKAGKLVSHGPLK